MAPVSDLLPRDYPCRSGYYYSGGGCYPKNAWYWWGRWVLAGVVVLFIIFVLVIFGCISNRRRRRRGLQPMYGTGWIPGTGGGKNAPAGQQQWQGYYAPPPPPQYNQQPPQQGQFTGTTYNPNDGYYVGGHNYGQQDGIQLQQPQHSYQPNQQVYSPPVGPPPGKA